MRVYYNLDGDASLSEIEKASDKVEKVLNQYYGSGDYSISNLADRKRVTDTRYAMTLIFTFLSDFWLL